MSKKEEEFTPEKKAPNVLSAAISGEVNRRENILARIARGERPVLVVVELGSCDGCCMVIVNLDGTLLDLTRVFDLKQMRIAMRGVWPGHIDILMIEGAVTCEEEAEEIRELRERSDYVIAIGACAVLGGIPAMRPPCALKAAQEGAYGDHVKGQRPIQSCAVEEVIRVDGKIRGCPISTADVVASLQNILIGGRPDDSERPVCMKCKLKDNGCLLFEGRTCLGPVTYAGCDPMCPSVNNFCWGCRGLLPLAREKDSPTLGALYEIAKQHDIPIEDVDRKLRMANKRHFILLEEKIKKEAE